MVAEAVSAVKVEEDLRQYKSNATLLCSMPDIAVLGNGSIREPVPPLSHPRSGVGLLCNLMNGNVLHGRPPMTDERIYLRM
jgi:hypothetical protein